MELLTGVEHLTIEDGKSICGMLVYRKDVTYKVCWFCEMAVEFGVTNMTDSDRAYLSSMRAHGEL